MDRTTAYAQAVRDGHIVAGRLVRQACLRHLDDLERQGERGIRWKVDEAEEAIQFFPDVLCLPEETDAGEQAPEDEPEDGSPFVLSGWQEFIVGSLMGWYSVKGYRRFRTAYIETAKGSGKTPLCAGLLIYLLVADGERGARYYVAAVTRDQARIAFADCEKMVKASPQLRALVKATVNNLAILEIGAFIRAISSEKRALDGKRVSGAVIDEVHEHPTATVVNKIRKGTKGRRNALIMEPTNSGFDRTSVCWAHHEYSRRVLDRTIEAEDWFAFVCGLDPCDACWDKGRWFPDEECPHCDDWKTEGPHWLKPNPNLGISVSWQYVRDLVRQAIGMPSEQSDTLRFNFCVWTTMHSVFLNMQKWRACAGQVPASALVGARCFAGLDLGQSDDFSAYVRIWELLDGRIWAVPTFWIPSAAIERFKHRPYQEWQRAGALRVVSGEVIDYGVVEADVFQMSEDSGVIELAYDRRFAEQMAQNLTGRGLTMVPVSQGWALTGALRKLGDLVTAATLVHDNNPVQNWMAANLLVQHGRDKALRADKDKAPDKIDGQVALVQALEALIRQPKATEPEYQVMVLGGGR